MNQESNQHRIDTLRHQWRSEPTPRRSLQLAEEYARSGDVGRALEVLYAGLEKHPTHVSSRVALGRYLLEAGRPHTVLPLSGVTHMTPQEEVAENLLLLQLAFLREALGADEGENP